MYAIGIFACSLVVEVWVIDVYSVRAHSDNWACDYISNQNTYTRVLSLTIFLVKSWIVLNVVTIENDVLVELIPAGRRRNLRPWDVPKRMQEETIKYQA